ncbi:MAG: hypothetical protein HY096_04320 [Nitrospinae bacterium]|nr:hypothetical protein [Nitrospinota bacterium]
MKRMILILCFCILFLILHIPLIPFYSITGQVYSEIKKPALGTEIKPDCKECHSRNATIRGSGKPAIPGQPMKGDGKPTPPPDHIRKDKRKNKGQQ